MARLFARNSSSSQTAVANPPASNLASASPAGLRSYEDLHRPALWGRLSDHARALELAQLPQPATLASVSFSPAPFDYRTDVAFQIWFTEVIAPVFHKRAVDAIHSWLYEAPSDAHLYVEGPANRGQMAVVSTLARQAMVHVPAPPDYCLVPNRSALNHAEVLELPTGTGARFTEALNHIISQINEMTRKTGSEDITHTTSQAAGATTAHQPLDTLLDALPQEPLPYITDLKQALRAAEALPHRPTIAQAVSAPRADIGSGGPLTAPVVIGIGKPTEQMLWRARGGILILDSWQLEAAWPLLQPILLAGAAHLSAQGGLSVPCPMRVMVIGTLTSYLEAINGRPQPAKLPLPGFSGCFRYRAVFEDQIAWNATTFAEATYATLAQDLAARAGLPALDPGGVAALIEEGARRAEPQNQRHLTTNLAAISDLVIETGKSARARQLTTEAPTIPGSMAAPNASMATERDLQETIRQRRERLSRRQDDITNAIMAGRRIVPTDGDEVGAITGLGAGSALLEEENYGSPFRLTVTVSPSERETLIDVEREANAAKEDHIMGELTMIGYLSWRYGQQHPVCLRARIREEQQFSRTGGPSASAAYLFTLLSALAGMPIYRAFAVTGAAGQHGEIQTIGSVNYKIEGFWELCKARWEAGERPEHSHGYGMLIPTSNAQDLMIQPKIARSIANDGWFKIYPIGTIDEGLPILTGISADEIHARVRKTLDRFYELTSRGKA